MRFSSDPTDKNQIRACEPGAIHLHNQTLTSHTIISAAEIITEWNPPAIDALSIDDFAPALALNPEILLFGTGNRQVFPDIALLTEIMRAGIAIEVMETIAACRTFNVLINERRSVVAALLVDTTKID